MYSKQKQPSNNGTADRYYVAIILRERLQVFDIFIGSIKIKH